MAKPKKGEQSPKPNQLLLIKNLRKIASLTTIVKDPTGWELGSLSKTLQNFDTSKSDGFNALYPYVDDPDLLVSTLVNPPIAAEFIHACPNLLSVLEPHLRFWIRDNEGYEEEVYFGDYSSAEFSTSLAQVRRKKGTLDEVFGPRSQGGSNVGIKSFSWEYSNKHEGDRIIGANLELYFGSLVELLNVNYLKFLFTNGLRTPHANDLAPAAAKQNPTVQTRIKELTKKIKAAEETIKDSGNVSINSDFSLGAKNDFRQLRVNVGWSVPKGSQKELIKLFRGKTLSTKRDKLNRFLESIQAMQSTIMLNLVDYNVNFQQEGPTTLSIQYVGSTDNYISSTTSDIFGSHNTKSELLQQTTAIPVDDINKDHVWPLGYLAGVLASAKQKGPDGQTLAMVRGDKLIEETDILMDKLSLNHLKYKGEADVGNNHEELAQWMGPVDTAYDKLQLAQMDARMQNFLAQLIDGNKVFVGTVKNDSTKSFAGSEVIDLGEADVLSKDKLRARLKDMAKAYDKMDPDGSPLQGDTIAPNDDADPNGPRKIYFIRLGDLIAQAMKNAQMRRDINLILGTFDPYALGIPGYDKASKDRFEALYNLPISIEYVNQFFYDNVVATGSKTYPFKRFIDDLLSMTGRLLNEVSEYRLRVILDMSLHSSFWDIQTLDRNTDIYILTEDLIKAFPRNLKNMRLIGGMASPVYNYYVVFARQMNHAKRKGIKADDEKEGIFHYIIGAECGIAKKFNFKKMDQAHFKALNIESAHFSSKSTTQSSAAARALFLPQNINIEMVGNTIHKNGDLIYVDSRMVLGAMGNEVLALGGYYRVVKSKHTISAKGFTTQIDCVFEKRTLG